MRLHARGTAQGQGRRTPRAVPRPSRTPRRAPRPLLAWLALLFIAAGCGGGPILANEPLAFPSPAVPTSAPSRSADPIPVVFPRDDGPHDRLTEWWYYTGHLKAADGRRFGFEAVVFRAERGAVPSAWAAHLALTDEGGQRFVYAQRSEIGPKVDRSPRDAAGAPTGFDLQVSGLSPALIAEGSPLSAAPWRLAGANGADRIDAGLTPEEATAAGASFSLALDLRAIKQPALHDSDGFVDFGPAGSSYYYSRTRLDASGALVLDGERLDVSGTAWFDHQWGDFVSVGGGGWDWFAINLDDGTDLTFSIVRDENSNEVLQYGTLVRPSGEVVHLRYPEDYALGRTGFGGWRSPLSGVTYPNSWEVIVGPEVEEESEAELIVRLRPTVTDQELDTRATTGVIYWEGSQLVEAQRKGVPIGGEAYVEITRYGP